MAMKTKKPHLIGVAFVPRTGLEPVQLLLATGF